jgi:adenosylcobinamide-phosphate synthase
MIDKFVWLLIAAFMIDCIVGDPRSKFHPVVMIGNLIAFWDRKLRNAQHSPLRQRLAGALLVLLVLGITYSVASLLLTCLASFGSWAEFVGGAVLLSFTISPRSLAAAGSDIQRHLLAGELGQARTKVGWIVGRDTDRLDVAEVTRATVETVAENIVDGIISPLFYAAIGGVELACLYRAVNTLDSMVGYKNDKYRYFGMVAARTDDIFNFIPARLTAVLLLISASLLRYDAAKAAKLAWRDAPRHPSPNSGWAEATVAGALGIRLGGLNYYGGVPSQRAFMGDNIVQLQPEHIRCTARLMYLTTVIFIVLISSIRYFANGV